jgi:hypothetical protein
MGGRGTLTHSATPCALLFQTIFKNELHAHESDESKGGANETYK